MIILQAHASSLDELQRLKKAYPDHIQSVTRNVLIWRDGTIMPVGDDDPQRTMQEKLDSPTLFDQMVGVYYQQGIPEDTAHYSPSDDPGRIRYLPFFTKMYGESEEIVRQRCATIYWMPLFFANKYPLEVTTINGVDQHLLQISNELEILVSSHPEYLPFLDFPGETFLWRLIANTDRLSPHSFGMTIDINPNLSNYWQSDLTKAGLPISEEQTLTYCNYVPWEIITIFERNGFISGSKWKHYDSMHFEYRPELLVAQDP